jgi:hypothetical protein
VVEKLRKGEALFVEDIYDCPKHRKCGVVEVLDFNSETAFVRTFTPLGRWEGGNFKKTKRPGSEIYIPRGILVKPRT